MPLLGAHQSIAGGFHKAAERAHAAGCQCLQIFTKNTNQWRAREITAAEAQRFRLSLEDLGLTCPVAHDSYLVNLASPDADLWRKSIDAMVEELLRAETLGIPWVVAHPGAFINTSEATGLRRIVAALNEVLLQTRGKPVGCLLETTAGQGTSLGWQFEQLAAMLDGAKDPDRLGVCFDTCHVFAAGYPLSTPAEYRATMRRFDKVVGLERIRAFHLNDSLRECGSRIDRHAHIGQGCMGLAAFRSLVRDRRFRRLPMILETPKGPWADRPWDEINLETLRGLIPETAGKPAR
ncbi:MAG: deoxyribonuclease IV [Thermoguttaceae bacterium]|jgi:deoxyribonuclease-4